MAGLKLNHIYKVYPNGTKAVSDFTMDIEDKEFIIFVGPSGCGKSTTLRMIAGLEDITTGELSIDGTVVNGIDPKDRDIAMVFQNYALYPHMTVYKNMAFGLKLRKMAKEDIDVRVKEAAEILGITEYLEKKPGEMSGGQRQRVALGRAIVREPKVFLLDEPLSNLDAKLRTQMRSEILKLHRKLQTTFIYVTHDQVEAMTMGTRIVVMKDGFIQQIDTPRNLYNYPCNKFVAGFIGTPQMNFWNGKLKKDGGKVKMTITGTELNIEADYSHFTKLNPVYLEGDKTVVMGLRSEHVSPNASEYPYKAKCRISHYEDLGTDCLVYGDLDLNNTEFTESETKIVMKAPAGSVYETGDIIEISLDLDRLHMFDPETEKTIAGRIPEASSAECSVLLKAMKILGANIEIPEAINIEKGKKYDVQIPPDAITVYKEQKPGLATAKFISEEQVNNLRLLKLKTGPATVYSLYGGEKYEEGQNVYLDLDLKRITFTENGQVKHSALCLDNSLRGTLVKRKMVEERTKENGKVVKEKGFVIDATIAGYTAEVPDEFGLKLLSSGDSRKIFENELEFRFSPYAVSVSETGISAHVEKILDYGKEKFAVCTVDGKTINVSADNVKEGDDICLALDFNKLLVCDTVRDIELI